MKSSPRAVAVCALSAAILSLAVAWSGCQKAESTSWPKEGKEHATYADQIPIYPGAVLDNVMGADLYGDTKADHAKRMVFWFKTDASAEDVLAWYEEKYPDADRSDPFEDGSAVELSFAPEEGEEGAVIGVLVEEDGFRIFEQMDADE